MSLKCKLTANLIHCNAMWSNVFLLKTYNFDENMKIFNHM